MENPPPPLFLVNALLWNVVAEFCALLQTVSTASELRKPTYWIVAAKAIDYEQMLLLMAGVKWDIKEIMSQHNIYVDVLLKVMCCVVLNGFYVTWLVDCLTARLHVFIFRQKEKGYRQVKAAVLKVRFNQVEKKQNHVLVALIIHDEIYSRSSLLWIVAVVSWLKAARWKDLHKCFFFLFI